VKPPDGWTCPMGRPWADHEGPSPGFLHVVGRGGVGCIPANRTQPAMATGPGPVERNTLWDEVAEQDHPAVRNTDLDTSHEAWAMVEPVAGALRAMVLVHLRTQGPATCGEIALAHDYPRDSISPRMAELRHKGLVENSGTKRRMPGKKSRQTVWQAVPPDGPGETD